MPPRLLVAALVVAGSLIAASPSVAHAGTPCWNQVLSDWTLDGKIDGHYSPRCLHSALRHVPEDLGDYSSIKDDINAALLDAVRPKNSTNKHGSQGSGNGNGNSDSMGPGSGGSGGPGGGRGGTGNGTGQGSAVVPHAGTRESVPSHSRSIPLPLLILGAVGLAAALAAASPPLVRRLRARFPRPRAAPQTHRG